MWGPRNIFHVGQGRLNCRAQYTSLINVPYSRWKDLCHWHTVFVLYNMNYNKFWKVLRYSSCSLQLILTPGLQKTWHVTSCWLDTRPTADLTCVLQLTWHASSSWPDMCPPADPDTWPPEDLTRHLLLTWHMTFSWPDTQPPADLTRGLQLPWHVA